MPGLKKAEIAGDLEEAGIDKVYVVCVNDGAVMTAWKKDQGLAASELIEFVADTQAELTDALDLAISHPGPHYKLGAHTKRCKRAAMVVVDGVITEFVKHVITDFVKREGFEREGSRRGTYEGGPREGFKGARPIARDRRARPLTQGGARDERRG